MATATHAEPLRLAVLISGAGTTLRNLIQRIERAELAADIRLVISSRPDAGGLEFARQKGIPQLVVSRGSSRSAAQFSHAIFQPCRVADVQLVVMGGFLKHVLIPADFAGRVMNIHPALVPAFCGKGLYGRRVHEAVLEYGVKVSGCTVHFVDDQYDHGPIILQRVVPVLDDDSPETLAARVFEQECAAYPEAIRLYAEGHLRIEGRRVSNL
jgi:formyltetrahydrofolate-dependent phosphoribosylglycinamide formyltransferase